MKRIKIGKQNLKTALSVFIAISLSLIFKLIDKAFNLPGDGYTGLSGFYTPFFAGIAAAYTSHKDFKQSLKQAKVRSIGSVIGGFYGMVLIILVEYLFITLLPIENQILYNLIAYSIVSLGIILLIYIIVKTKNKEATFITCLTYLSVTISIRNGGMPIMQFACNRIISTLIGVFIALMVNNIRMLSYKNKNLLMICNTDDVINYSDDYLLSFTRYKINDLFQKDANLILATKKCGKDKVLFNDVHLNKPLILMDGVCIYDDKIKEYVYSCDFSLDTKLVLNHYLKDHNYDYFTYIINDMKLVVYHLDFNKEVTHNYYKNERANNHYPFVYAPVLDNCDVALYEVVLHKDEYNNFIEQLKRLNVFNNIKLNTVNLSDEYLVLIIKPFNGSRSVAISNLSNYKENMRKVMFITSVDNFDYGDDSFKFCLKNASIEVKNECDYILDSEDFNDVLRFYSKLYYIRNLDKYLSKLKKKSLH